MKFRTAILLMSMAMVVAIVAIISWVVADTVARDARAGLDDDLTRGALVFQEQLSQRHSLLAANAAVVAGEPRLRAVVATEDIDRATLVDVSSELRRASRSDLFLLLDGGGFLIADVAHPQAEGDSLGDRPLVVDALSDGAATGLWISDERVIQVAARALTFGDTVVGVLVLGRVIDDAMLVEIARQTGGAVVILDQERSLASSLPPGTTRGALPLGANEDGAHLTMAVDGEPHRAVSRWLRGGDGLRVLVLRSLDEALATSERVVWVVYAVGTAAVLLAVGLALWLSRRLSEPLQRLVDFTEQIAQGRLGGHLSPQGPRELQALAISMNRMTQQLIASREQEAAKERLEGELEIATRIQTSILPVQPTIGGYEIAASMETASEVGGDYYDVIPTAAGGWIGIGDVAGHGLSAGVVMLMAQSATGILARAMPEQSPAALIARLNSFLYDNVRVRLDQDDFMTCTLMRCHTDGEVVYAGAHEEIVVWREAARACERLRTPGPWLAVLGDVRHAAQDRHLQLAPGDLMVLYTDGLTEAMNDRHEQFGMSRLCRLVEDHAEQPVERVVASVRDAVEAWCHTRADDMTVVVVRFVGHGSKP